MRLHNRRLRGQRGAVAVEFALIMVPLFLMVIGAIEFGRVYSQLQVYQGAAREGARCAAVQASGLSTCTVQDAIATHLAGSTYPAPSTVNQSITCTNATRGQTVVVSWEQPFELDIPFWGDMTFTRTISGAFRCE